MEEVQQQLAEETERHKRSHEADMALLKAEHDEAAAKLHAEHQLQMQKLHALTEGAGGSVEQAALEQLEAAMKERDALQEATLKDRDTLHEKVSMPALLRI